MPRDSYYVSDCPSGIKALITTALHAAQEVAFVGSKPPEEREEVYEAMKVARYNLETAIAKKLTTRDAAIVTADEVIEELYDHMGTEGLSQATISLLSAWRRDKRKTT